MTFYRRQSKLVLGLVVLCLPWGNVLGGNPSKNNKNPPSRQPRGPLPPPPPRGERGSPGGPGPLPQMFLGPEKMTLDRALDWCKQNQSHLLSLPEWKPSVTVASDILRPNINLEELGIREVWLGIELQDRRSGSSESQEEPLCGMYSTGMRKEQVSCFDQHTTICYKRRDPETDFGKCSQELFFTSVECPGSSIQHCVAVETDTKTVRTWFQAKEQCGNYNARVLPPDLGTDVIQCIMNTSNPYGDWHVWVDESEVHWEWLPSGRGRRKEEVRHFGWAPGAPSDKVKKCVKFVPHTSGSNNPTQRPQSSSIDSDTSDDDSSEDGPGWHDEDCSQELHFICMTRQSSEEPPHEGRGQGQGHGQGQGDTWGDWSDQKDAPKPKEPEVTNRRGPTRKPPVNYSIPGQGNIYNGQPKTSPKPREQMAGAENSSNIETILYISIPIATSLVILAVIGAVCYVRWSQKKERKMLHENVASALSNPGYTPYDTVSVSSLYQSLDESRIDTLVNTTPYTDLQSSGRVLQRPGQGQGQGHGQGHAQLDREDSDYYSEIGHGSISREPSLRTISETSLDCDKSRSDGGEEDQQSEKQKPGLTEEQIKNNHVYDSPKPMAEYLELLPDEPIHSNAEELASNSEVMVRDNSRSHVRDKTVSNNLSRDRESNKYHPS